MTERITFAFALSAVCVSSTVFLLCAIGCAGPAMLALALIVGLGCGSATSLQMGSTVAIPRRWLLFFVGVAAPFAVVYLVNAAAPETSADGAYYHLGLVRRYLDHHGFYRLTTNMYASLTQGCEMLFLAVYPVLRNTGTALVHCVFLLMLPVAMIAYSARFLSAPAGILGGLFVFVSPVIGMDGSSAYVDVCLAFSGFAMFYALELWDASRSSRMLIVAGLLGGFSFAVKYTGSFALVYLIAFIAWRSRRLKSVLIAAGAAALITAPWLVKNWIIVRNPVSPFFNRVLPNPYVYPATEARYLHAMQHYNGAALGWDTPYEITVRGRQLQGTLGPVFLLAPLALAAALRGAHGRRILAAGVLFALPWFANLGTRFLIPAVPFIALAMAMTLVRWRVVSIAAVVFNAVACWPWVLTYYCAPANWRITHFPVAAAVRIEPESEYLDKWAPDVRIAWMLQDKMPPNGVVYTAWPIREAYTDRTILLDYTAALNNRISETLNAAIAPRRQPSVRALFRFSPEQVRKLRLVATANAASWRVYEIEAERRGSAQAHPNPWDAGLAADGSLATFWSPWRDVRKGMFIEIDLGSTLRLDHVGARLMPGALVPMRLDAQLRSAEWRTLANAPGLETGIASPDLRRAAIAEARRNGITHLLIHDEEPLGPDFRQRASDWGVRPVAHVSPVSLYEILQDSLLTQGIKSETIRDKSVF
jgi:hypothetical protein